MGAPCGTRQGRRARKTSAPAPAPASARPQRHHRRRRSANPSATAAAAAALVAALAALAALAAAASPWPITGAVVRLSDANFDRETAPGSPPMLFSVGATWCHHCQALQPTLEELARLLASDSASDGGGGGSGGGAERARVGKVDGPKNRVLMMRLGVQGFPTLFLVRDGKAWRYSGRGPRTTEALLEFVRGGHRQAAPLPWHKSPVSPLGRAMGRAFSLPAMAGGLFSSLRERGYSELQLIAAAMAVPVLVGGAAICALDAVHTRRARAAAARAWVAHEHGE